MRDNERLKNILEAALLAAGRPLNLDALEKLFDPSQDSVGREAIRQCLRELKEEYRGRGMELCEVTSGFRLQVRAEYGTWVSRLWEEKPPRYSRALLETLALIVYRQPITRAEIEEVRGVSVSSGIIKTLLERGWIRALGHKEVPGRPALYGSTRAFLDYFGLKSLDELPNLAELKDLDQLQARLDFEQPEPQWQNAQNAEPSQGSGPNEGGAVDQPESESAVVMTLPSSDTQH
jgi:segregation and condensation protein B